jgi:hypothetical protein
MLALTGIVRLICDYENPNVNGRSADRKVEACMFRSKAKTQNFRILSISYIYQDMQATINSLSNDNVSKW